MRKCASCGRDIYKEFDLTIEGAVAEMRLKVQQESKLTCSAGIGPNRLIAKICSDFNKPNGQYRISNSTEEVENFVRKLPTRKMFGIGKVQAFMLKEALEIETIQDLYDKRGLLMFHFKETTLENYAHQMIGHGSDIVNGSEEYVQKARFDYSKSTIWVHHCPSIANSLCPPSCGMLTFC